MHGRAAVIDEIDRRCAYSSIDFERPVRPWVCPSCTTVCESGCKCKTCNAWIDDDQYQLLVDAHPNRKLTPNRGFPSQVLAASSVR